MEKGRSRFTVNATAYGHTNSDTSRSLASRPPYNRKSQSEFECRACGHRSHADLVGARNIGSRARAAVTAPLHAGLVPSVKAAGL
jgi:transposase